MQVQIKFRRTGSNSVYGSFKTGDIIRCDQSLAEHYVREGIAIYLPEPSKVVEIEEIKDAAKPRKVKGNHGNVQ